VACMVVCGSAFVTADSISRERREGTLGILLLTRLKTYDVVLGKLCAAGTTTYYALFGFVPALAIMVLAGGVSGGELGRTALALVNGVFLSRDRNVGLRAGAEPIQRHARYSDHDRAVLRTPTHC